MSPPAKRIFLSYSRTDRAACAELREALIGAGYEVFRDEDSLRVGDRWLTKLQSALADCEAFVVLVGRDGVRRWVGAEVEVALIRHLSPHEDTERLPIFPVLLEGVMTESLPPLLTLHQSFQWTAHEPVLPALCEAIARRTLRAPLAPFEGCPFLGLNAFQRGDAALFFGRRLDTLRMIACLGDQRETNPDQLRADGNGAYHRWLQIDGNSGTGKSSLVNAGLLPMIERGALWARTGFAQWRILGPMLPGKDPVVKLAEVFEHALIADPASRDIARRAQDFTADDHALALALRNFKADDLAFLLVIDQFEELFTFADPAACR